MSHEERSEAFWLLARRCASSRLGCGGGGKDAEHGRAREGAAAAGGGNAVGRADGARTSSTPRSTRSTRTTRRTTGTTRPAPTSRKQFEARGVEQNASGKFPEAIYDAGLAYQRCGNDKDAKAHFQQALADDPKFHYARAQLALYQYKADGERRRGDQRARAGGHRRAIPERPGARQPRDVPDAARLDRSRERPSGGKDDLGLRCAKQNLQRALAIDDGYMPAFNQLALYYFGSAKKKAARAARSSAAPIATNAALAKRADVQQLELAALVCSQAIRKNANYAPIHNTAGLIQNELGQVNSAVQEFQRRRRSSIRTFFEAQMNYAAVNLSVPRLRQAEGAYRKALEMRPNDYDAHLGLALALRGQIDDSNYDKQVAAVQARARRVQEDRRRTARTPTTTRASSRRSTRRRRGGGNDKTIAVLPAGQADLPDVRRQGGRARPSTTAP